MTLNDQIGCERPDHHLRDYPKSCLRKLHQRSYALTLTTSEERVDRRPLMELDDALLIHASPNSIDDLQRNASGLVTALDDIEDSAGAGAGRKSVPAGAPTKTYRGNNGPNPSRCRTRGTSVANPCFRRLRSAQLSARAFVYSSSQHRSRST